MSTVKWIATVSVIILIHSIAAATPEGAKAVKVSGGEDHTLVLTEKKFVWACGKRNYGRLGIVYADYNKWTLIRVHKGEMDSPSDYIEEINKARVLLAGGSAMAPPPTAMFR